MCVCASGVTNDVMGVAYSMANVWWECAMTVVGVGISSSSSFIVAYLLFLLTSWYGGHLLERSCQKLMWLAT